MKSYNITRRGFLKASMVGTACVSIPHVFSAEMGEKQHPNILWITSEDNSPMLGCYGDSFATTPNLDNFASEGILYENAFANAPVCAPARFTILTGMYACSMGTHHMRSRYSVPSFIKPFPEYLRKAGYYCTNRYKTDYNFETNDPEHWDECNEQASYKNRPPNQPFFSIFNLDVSHESSIHEPQSVTKHDPAKVTLPPYHPDTREIRHDWAQYYDKIEALDLQVGKILDDLEKDGFAEDTIVFYYSDHGGVLCRSKRFIYDTGTRVPMIIRFPKKYQHLAPGKSGTRMDRIVSFVDLAPTVLSLAGIEVPDYMEGEAFLGAYKNPPRKYAYLFRGRMDERYDMMLAVRDKKYKYIRNYMPHRIYGQHLEYLWKAPATRSWEKEYLEGRCNKAQSIFWQTKPPEELYDITSDPWEVNNLADDPQYKDVLERMRKAVMSWVREMKDPGFIPEGEMINRTQETTSFELVRRRDFPIERVIETAELATSRDAEKLSELIKRLQDEESSVRYWAATGCLILGDKALSAEAHLAKMLKDDSADVRIVVAEALSLFGRKDIALPVLVAELKNDNAMIALHAANALDSLGKQASTALSAIESVEKETGNKYLKRALSHTVDQLRK